MPTSDKPHRRRRTRRRRRRRRRRAKQREGRPWLAVNRRFNPSKRTPRRQLLRRRERQQTRRLQPRQHWSTPAPSVGRRCRTRRRSSSTLRASIPNPQCPQSWMMLRLKRPTHTMDLQLDTG